MMSLPAGGWRSGGERDNFVRSIRAIMARETLLDVDVSGLRIWTERFGGSEIGAVTGAVHSVTALHVVVREEPAIRRTEPGPGADAAKLLPSHAQGEAVGGAGVGAGGMQGEDVRAGCDGDVG